MTYYIINMNKYNHSLQIIDLICNEPLIKTLLSNDHLYGNGLYQRRATFNECISNIISETLIIIKEYC